MKSVAKSYLLAVAFIITNLTGSIAQSNSAPIPSPCGRGFLQIGRFCYKYSSGPSVTFDEANAHCRRLGAQLADVSQDDVNSDVETLIRRYGRHEYSYWVKVTNRADIHDYIGSRTSATRCTVIGQIPGYVIQDVTCDSRHMLVCQHEATIPTTLHRGKMGGFCVGKHGYFPHPKVCSRFFLCYNGRKFHFRCNPGQMFSQHLGRCITATNCSEIDEEDSVQCKAGYRKLHTKCYKVFKTSLSWEDANDTCVNEEKGNLVLIKSRRIMHFLKKLVKKSTRSYWIGLNDKVTSDTFVWNDGVVLSREHYNDWAKRSRRRFKEYKECVKLDKRAKFRWMDATCSDRNYFICEKDIWKQPNPDCGKNFKFEDPDDSEEYLRDSKHICHLIEGEIADAKSHSWQVYLRYPANGKCGGSLIDSCWVLTAAHCVTLPDITRGEEPTEVVLGDYDLITREDAEERLRIQKIYVHPKYSYLPPNNDIAIIKLEECSTRHNPICLPTSRDFSFATGIRCNIAGYGTVHPIREDFPDNLLEATVPLIGTERCKSLYKKRRNSRETWITDAMFCAGYLEGGSDACQGDSGGPLICHNFTSNRKTQLGIVSWGEGCSEANKPGVYTKIAHFYHWIRNTTMINF